MKFIYRLSLFVIHQISLQVKAEMLISLDTNETYNFSVDDLIESLTSVLVTVN